MKQKCNDSHYIQLMQVKNSKLYTEEGPTGKNPYQDHTADKILPHLEYNKNKIHQLDTE